MSPSDIHTIQDFVMYCREVLAERPEYMREKEQERSAAAIVAVGGAGPFEELEKQYPQLTEIYDLASNLEISNTTNTTIDWRRIKDLVNELDSAVESQQEIMNPWKLKTINDALKYCQEAVRSYDVKMTPKEKESLASGLLGFYASDHFSEWRVSYPVVDQIEWLASDLSWSNAHNVDDDWEKLLQLIAQLEQEIASRK